MRTKFLVFMMSLLFFLGLNAPASAEWVTDDWGYWSGCGDAYLYNKDIMKAKVEVFELETGFTDFYNFPIHSGMEEPWIYLCLKMCPQWGFCSQTEAGCQNDQDCTIPEEFCALGYCEYPSYDFCKTSEDCPPELQCINFAQQSTLPGVVVWEFDVDSNPATGDELSTLGHWEYPYKECPGFDLLIMQAFRKQTRGPYPDRVPSTMAWCRHCGMYNDMPRYIGEWFAVSAGYSGYPPPEDWSRYAADWGRDIPKPPEGCTYDKYCTKLPYGEILKHAWLYSGYFDLAYALNHAPRWQVSTYWDPNYILDPWGWRYAGDGDDYYHADWEAVNITDWLPSEYCNKAEGQIDDGGLCHKYQKMFQVCMDKMACERNVADQVSTAGCYFDPSITDQISCEAAGCTWLAAKERCVNDMCLGDFNMDTKVKAQERNILMRETGRIGCPCATP